MDRQEQSRSGSTSLALTKLCGRSFGAALRAQPARPGVLPAHLQQRRRGPSVDFKQAYDRGGEWPRAVRAIYAAAPMGINAPGLKRRTIHSTQGLKQGRPLSATLFSFYIAD